MIDLNKIPNDIENEILNQFKNTEVGDRSKLFNYFVENKLNNLNDKRTEHMTEALNELQNVQPVYKEFKGWNTDIADIDNFEELPNEAKDYIKYLESEIGVPISMISIGPKRHQIIHHKKSSTKRDPPFRWMTIVVGSVNQKMTYH